MEWEGRELRVEGRGQRREGKGTGGELGWDEGRDGDLEMNVNGEGGWGLGKTLLKLAALANLISVQSGETKQGECESEGQVPGQGVAEEICLRTSCLQRIFG
jgi:hypothetical protein